jgi:hypothetical protein
MCGRKQVERRSIIPQIWCLFTSCTGPKRNVPIITISRDTAEMHLWYVEHLDSRPSMYQALFPPRGKLYYVSSCCCS